MTKQGILVLILILLALGVGFFFLFGNNQAEAPGDIQEEMSEEEVVVQDEMEEGSITEEEMPVVDDSNKEVSPPPISEEETAPKNVVVTYTSAGYSPSTVTVFQGDTVTFRNENSSGMWTASAIHPTHTVYPGTSISKCGSAEVMFDACEPTPSDSSWSFTFNVVGSWNYHNHVNAGHFGKVVVE